MQQQPTQRVVEQSRQLRNVEPLTQGSIPRAIVRIALPTWGAFITHDLMGIVDMFFVGKLGPVAVAAVAMSGLMFGIIMMVSQGSPPGRRHWWPTPSERET